MYIHTRGNNHRATPRAGSTGSPESAASAARAAGSPAARSCGNTRCTDEAAGGQPGPKPEATAA